MAESPYGTFPQQPFSPDQNDDASLLNCPQSNFDETHPFQQNATESFGLFTPQATRLLANDTRSLPVCEAEEQPMSQNLAASAQAQNFFIHTTSILKASFLKTPTPSVGEISGLAAQTGLDQYGVSTWFDIMRSLKGNDGAKVLPTPEATQAISTRRPDFNVSDNVAPPTMDSNMLRTIDLRSQPLQKKSATRLKRSSSGKSHPSKRQQEGRSSQSRCTTLTLNDQTKDSRRRPSRALGHKEYCCPTCKFQTGKMDQWYTHQTRKHFPSEVFVCDLNLGVKFCNKGPDSPCKRKDNFVTHLKESHGYQHGEALDREISKRTFRVTGLFHDKCGFCSKSLDTRETSMEHIGAHIESGDTVDNWTHQCTSLDHKLQHHVHFKSILDEPEPEGDSSSDDNDDDDDNNDDYDNTNQGNFGGWTQGGDYDAGDGGNGFDRNHEQDFDGGDFPPTRFTTASKSVEYHQESTLGQVRFSDNFCSPNVPLQSLVVQRTLGQGGSGTVFEVTHGNSAGSFALKTIIRTDSSSKASQYRAFINEVRVMTTLRHPHIVELLGSYIHSDCFSLLTAPVADTDLSKFLMMETSLGNSLFLDHSRILMRGMSAIAAGLDYIHSTPVCGSHIAHMDLKPANVLIKDSNFMIADFGISKLRSLDEISTTDNIQVTPEYAAPETIEGRRQGLEVDIWSLGCVFLEVVTWMSGRNLSDFAEFRRTESGDKSFHKTLKKTKDWTRMLSVEQRRRNRSFGQDRPVPLDMILEMLSEDPKERPTAREIWLRFPKCPCCSDWQSTKHKHTSRQHGIDDEALCPTSTTLTAEKPFATRVSNWTSTRSPSIWGPHSAVPDKPTSRIKTCSKKRRVNKWHHKLDA